MNPGINAKFTFVYKTPFHSYRLVKNTGLQGSSYQSFIKFCKRAAVNYAVLLIDPRTVSIGPLCLLHLQHLPWVAFYGF